MADEKTSPKPAEPSCEAFDFMIEQKKETHYFDCTAGEEEKARFFSLQGRARRSTYKGKLFLITPGGPAKIEGFPERRAVDLIG